MVAHLYKFLKKDINCMKKKGVEMKVEIVLDKSF